MEYNLRGHDRESMIKSLRFAHDFITYTSDVEIDKEFKEVLNTASCFMPQKYYIREAARKRSLEPLCHSKKTKYYALD